MSCYYTDTSMDNYVESYVVTSSSRVMRNRAEKMRRDKLNTHISEISSLVPMCNNSSKKMDKTSILRLAATYLRMNKTLIADTNWSRMPKILESINLSQYLMEDLEGVFLVASSSGKIIFISHTVEKYLGYSQVELLGQSLYTICHKDDQDTLKKNLTPDDGFPYYCNTDSHDDSSSSDTATTSSSSSQSSPTQQQPQQQLQQQPPTSTSSSTSTTSSSSASCELPHNFPVDRQRRSFYIRLGQRAVSRTEQAQYEHIHFVGDLRVPTKLELHQSHTRSRRHKELSFNSNEIVLVAFGRLYKDKHISDVCLLEANKEEYITRHEPTGKMIHVDHRIAIVAGYLSEEVMGLSAFNFMHKDDVTWTMVALKQMFDKGEGFGMSTYRLRAKNGEYIYMRTCGYLEFDKDTQSIASFVCVNSLISEEEGKKGLDEMKRRFSPQVLKIHKVRVSPSDYGEVEMPSSMAEMALQGSYSDDKLKAAIREMVSSLYMSAHRSNSTRDLCLESSVSSTTEQQQQQQQRPTVLREVISSHSVRLHNGGLKRNHDDDSNHRRSRNNKHRRRDSFDSQLQVEVPPMLSPDSILMRVEGSVLRSPRCYTDSSELLSMAHEVDTTYQLMNMDETSPSHQSTPSYQTLTTWQEEPPGGTNLDPANQTPQPVTVQVDSKLDVQPRPDVVQKPMKSAHRKHTKPLMKSAQQVQQELQQMNKLSMANVQHNIGV